MYMYAIRLTKLSKYSKKKKEEISRNIAFLRCIGMRETNYVLDMYCLRSLKSGKFDAFCIEIPGFYLSYVLWTKNIHVPTAVSARPVYPFITLRTYGLHITFFSQSSTNF